MVPMAQFVLHALLASNPQDLAAFALGVLPLLTMMAVSQCNHVANNM
jgi:hypothetical protein